MNAVAASRIVVVLIPTRGRPAELRRCLRSLTQQRLDGGYRMRVTIVDNNEPGDLETTAVIRQYSDALDIDTRHCSTPGYATVRNALLSHIPPDADFFAFIDDDGEASPDWLQSLLTHALDSGGHDVVYGSVHSALPEAGVAPELVTWMEEWGVISRGEERHPTTFATGNLLVNVRSWRKAGSPTFDTRLDRLGGEDTHWIGVLLGRGLEMSFAHAPVVDHVPAARCRKSYWRMRTFNGGRSHYVRMRPAASVRRYGLTACVGALARVIVGIGELVISPLIGSQHRSLSGQKRILRGAGIMAQWWDDLRLKR